MAKFQFKEIILNGTALTARLGAGTGAANQVDDKEVGKAVKIAADSRYNLCSVGDPIEAFVAAVETATLDDFTIGTVQAGGRKEVLADGLQATPGTGTLAIGDYVVAGTMVAKGTALADESSQKVVKATSQPGVAVVLADNLVATINAGLATVAAQQKNGAYGWKVVSLGSVGTGAVGTKVLIERVR